MVRPMTIQCAFLATPFCIIATMFSEKSASSSKSLSTGDRPWGFSPKWEVSLDPLPRSIFNGEMVVVSVEAVVLLFYACFELGAFALVIVKSSQTTRPTVVASKPPNPKPELASTEINSGVQGKGWS